MSRLRGPLDVLGVVVATPEHDHVLDPARHYQFAIDDGAEVPGRDRAVAETRGGLGRLAPVPPGHVRTGDDDLADPPACKRFPGNGVDDVHPGAVGWASTCH